LAGVNRGFRMPYEIRFYRCDGSFSVLCLVNFASDRHAVSSARLLLDDQLPTAAVWQENRLVADVRRPQLAA
jgi:hypothetical protein